MSIQSSSEIEPAVNSDFASQPPEVKASVLPFVSSLGSFVKWATIDPDIGNRRFRIFLRVSATYASHPDASLAGFQLAMLQKHQRADEPVWSDGNTGLMQIRRCRARALKSDAAEYQDGNRKGFRLKVENGRTLLLQAQSKARLARQNVPKPESVPGTYRNHPGNVPKPSPTGAENVPKPPALRLRDSRQRKDKEGRGISTNGVGRLREQPTRQQSPPSDLIASNAKRGESQDEENQAQRLCETFNRRAGEQGIPQRQQPTDTRILDAIRKCDTQDEEEQAQAVIGMFAEDDRWALDKGHGVAQALKRWDYFATLGAELAEAERADVEEERRAQEAQERVALEQKEAIDRGKNCEHRFEAHTRACRCHGRVRGHELDPFGTCLLIWRGVRCSRCGLEEKRERRTA